MFKESSGSLREKAFELCEELAAIGLELYHMGYQRGPSSESFFARFSYKDYIHIEVDSNFRVHYRCGFEPPKYCGCLGSKDRALQVIQRKIEAFEAQRIKDKII
jgi:hypothetical protein